MPFAAGVLLGLYAFQRFGHARIGAVFGPVIAVWFTTLGILGVVSIVQTPAACLAH